MISIGAVLCLMLWFKGIDNENKAKQQVEGFRNLGNRRILKIS